MKKTDIAMIILIASVSILGAYFIAASLPIFRDANKPVNVKVATPISETVTEPDSKLFNSEAINPTVEVIIGSGGSDSPATTPSETPESPTQGQ